MKKSIPTIYNVITFSLQLLHAHLELITENSFPLELDLHKRVQILENTFSFYPIPFFLSIHIYLLIIAISGTKQFMRQ